MRTYAALALAVLLGACASNRVRVPAAEPVAAAPGAVAVRGPVEASDLARETGLGYEDVGNSVLLSSGDLRARFFPGNDRVSLDGRMVSMGEPARRQGTALVVPAAGADAVRREVAAAAARRVAVVTRPPAPVLPPPPVPTPVTLKPVDLPVQRLSGSGSPDASWTALAAPERRWRYVVIHHSDDHEGCCAKYDRVHLQKGWENGCGYDFVIGNGTQSGDGEVEPGPRWVRQQTGAHTKTPDNLYNEEGIGICLVGDFEHGGRPTARQYDALVRLTRWLMARYDIPVGNVLRHGDCKSTACPGKNFPWSRYLGDVAGGSLATPP